MNDISKDDIVVLIDPKWLATWQLEKCVDVSGKSMLLFRGRATLWNVIFTAIRCLFE